MTSTGQESARNNGTPPTALGVPFGSSGSSSDLRAVKSADGGEGVK